MPPLPLSVAKYQNIKHLYILLILALTAKRKAVESTHGRAGKKGISNK
jgi:hypothetical protein